MRPGSSAFPLQGLVDGLVVFSTLPHGDQSSPHTLGPSLSGRGRSMKPMHGTSATAAPLHKWWRACSVNVLSALLAFGCGQFVARAASRSRSRSTSSPSATASRPATGCRPKECVSGAVAEGVEGATATMSSSPTAPSPATRPRHGLPGSTGRCRTMTPMPSSRVRRQRRAARDRPEGDARQPAEDHRQP